MAPFIRLKSISKHFADVVAVDDLSLDIEKGELFCLLGASGCGKSTLLRLLAGFESPTKGVRLKLTAKIWQGLPPPTGP